MALSGNKVAPLDNSEPPTPLDEAKALVDTLIKVVACYRHLSSCVGGCTDSARLRHELRLTRERAQELALAGRQLLTARLRDKGLPEEERQEMDLLWVAFSASLELLHADMCKVFNVAQNFSLSNNAGNFVQTGMQGETTELAARALSLSEPSHHEMPASVERLEQGDLEVETARVDQMLEDMEQKVNVLRWTVEARGPQYAEQISIGGGSSMALFMDEEDPGRYCDRSQVFLMAVLSSVVAGAALLSFCIVFLV